MKKLVLKIAFLLVILLLSVSLSACVNRTESTPRGLILPHHLLVKEKLTEVYQLVADDKVERVIILSPNHFGHGFNWMQTSSKLEIQNLDSELIASLDEKRIVFDEPKYFEKEHGVFVHYPFVIENFANAKVVPVIIKNGAPKSVLDNLIEEFVNMPGIDKTMFIASIDFTHLTKEEEALQNDNRTIEYLEAWSDGDVEVELDDLRELAKSEESEGDAIAFDSPESLYILLKVMERTGARDFELLVRTSTFTETGIDETDKMTSHLFGKFDIL